MDFWTIFGVVGFSSTYAVAGAMLSLFVIGTWRRRGKGVLSNIAFAALFVALPFVLGTNGPEKTASFIGWVFGGVIGFAYGIYVLRTDGDEAGTEESA